MSLPLIMNMEETVAQLSCSKSWLWKRRARHPLYQPDNKDKGRGKKAWYFGRRVELMARVEAGELTRDQALIVLEREREARAAEYKVLIENIDVGRAEQKIAQRNRRRAGGAE